MCLILSSLKIAPVSTIVNRLPIAAQPAVEELPEKFAAHLPIPQSVPASLSGSGQTDANTTLIPAKFCGSSLTVYLLVYLLEYCMMGGGGNKLTERPALVEHFTKQYNGNHPSP